MAGNKNEDRKQDVKKTDTNQSSQVQHDSSGGESVFQKEVELLKSQYEVKLSSLQKESEDWKSKSLRLAADLQNSMRQQELDIAQNAKVSKKRVMSALMQFLNTLYISFNFIPEGINDEGMTFINTLKTSFTSVFSELEGVNITIIKPEKGASFDPQTMSALNEAEIASGDGAVIIENIVGLGLVIDGQVIQPSTVIVKKVDN